MDMTKYITENYITVEEVKENKKKQLVILNKGEEKEGKFGPQAQFEIQLVGSDEVKLWTPYSDPIKKLIELYGPDSTKWVGKVVNIGIEKNKNDKEIIIVID